MKINSGAQREARVERIGGDDEWRAVQSSTSRGKVLMRQTSVCVYVCVFSSVTQTLRKSSVMILQTSCLHVGG